MMTLLFTAACGRLFNVGDETANKDTLRLADGGTCNPVTCTLACQYGFQHGADGCEICACNPPPAPVQCGPTTCAAGEECCNESCGICTPPGGFCTQQACAPVDGG